VVVERSGAVAFASVALVASVALFVTAGTPSFERVEMALVASVASWVAAFERLGQVEGVEEVARAVEASAAVA